MTDLKPGRYRHYKGNYYQVMEIAHDHETLEELVVYKGLYDHPHLGREPLFVRPKKMFMGTVKVNGQNVPRFVYEKE